jgi:hypothetical protein
VPSSIHGRALLWILDDGTKYMDRVYTNRNGLDGLFEKWVTKMDISRNNDSTKKSVNVVANDGKYPIWIHLNIIIQWMVF